MLGMGIALALVIALIEFLIQSRINAELDNVLRRFSFLYSLRCLDIAIHGDCYRIGFRNELSQREQTSATQEHGVESERARAANSGATFTGNQYQFIMSSMCI